MTVNFVGYQRSTHASRVRSEAKTTPVLGRDAPGVLFTHFGAGYNCILRESKSQAVVLVDRVVKTANLFWGLPHVGVWPTAGCIAPKEKRGYMHDVLVIISFDLDEEEHGHSSVKNLSRRNCTREREKK